jgi:ectoine hydroxylase-related dioxygenase (phytanoyl-CoA dioxygenase family)
MSTSNAPTTAPHITEQDIRDYRQHGVVMLRNVLDASTIHSLRDAVEDVLGSLSAHSDEYAKPGEGRFAQDMFLSQRQGPAGDAFRRLVHASALAEVAGRVMASNTARFFYDQMFVKEPGSVAPTPWHQDLPYWPLQGDQICGIWCPLDFVDADSGAVQYIKGSHQAGHWYRPKHFGGDDAYAGARGEPMPDIDALVPEAERAQWVMQPGDCIVFHGLTIHGSSGNRTAHRRRRAVSLRWMGDDATFDNRPGTYPFETTGQQPGNPLQGPLYPLVWTRQSQRSE